MRKTLLVALMVGLSFKGFAQGTLIDYQRADSIKKAFEQVYHAPSRFRSEDVV